MCEEPAPFGLSKMPSPYSVTETIDRISAAVQSKGAKIFARIDHSAEAAQHDLALAATELLIFGHPKVGTPLMQSAISTGLDLPLKVLATIDCENQVWLLYNNSEFLQLRHGFDAALLGGLKSLEVLMKQVLVKETSWNANN